MRSDLTRVSATLTCMRVADLVSARSCERRSLSRRACSTSCARSLLSRDAPPSATRALDLYCPSKKPEIGILVFRVVFFTTTKLPTHLSASASASARVSPITWPRRTPPSTRTVFSPPPSLSLRRWGAEKGANVGAGVSLTVFLLFKEMQRSYWYDTQDKYCSGLIPGVPPRRNTI